MGDRDTASLPTDPPIIIGGGGSTVVWIRKDQQAEQVDPAKLPDSVGKPAHTNLYDCYILKNFESSHIKVHDGRSGPHTPVGHPVQGRSHYTLFE